jgi:hypothetical protein
LYDLCIDLFVFSSIYLFVLDELGISPSPHELASLSWKCRFCDFSSYIQASDPTDPTTKKKGAALRKSLLTEAKKQRKQGKKLSAVSEHDTLAGHLRLCVEYGLDWTPYIGSTGINTN